MNAILAAQSPAGIDIISESPLTLAVPSSSRDGYNHTVTLFEDGTATCDCKGWLGHSRRIAGFACRHISAARAHAISTLPTPIRPAPKSSWSASQDKAWDECLGFTSTPAAGACVSCGNQTRFMLDGAFACSGCQAEGLYSADALRHKARFHSEVSA